VLDACPERRLVPDDGTDKTGTAMVDGMLFAPAAVAAGATIRG
jgi:hypothetical protein